MLRFFSRFQADFLLTSGWIRPVRVGGHAPFSPQELSQITIDVRNELINGAKGIGGDRKLNEDEMRRYINAQHSFEQTIERRNYQLTGTCGIWRDAN